LEPSAAAGGFVRLTPKLQEEQLADLRSLGYAVRYLRPAPKIINDGGFVSYTLFVVPKNSTLFQFSCWHLLVGLYVNYELPHS